ncbi:MAG: transposase [Lewinellaceae bacterium]|nr:transposase [Lewinellaceae bacterium]
MMEASGPYYLQLATHLFESGIAVSVVNPLVVKRYTQMLLLRAKTDRQDAKCLARYGEDQKPTEWQPNEQYINQLGQLQALLNQYIKQRTALNNQLDAQRSSGVPNPAFQASAEKIYKMLNDEIAQVEQQMKNLADQYHKEQMDALQTIPGIGKKTAMVLVLITHGFEALSKRQTTRLFHWNLSTCLSVWLLR